MYDEIPEAVVRDEVAGRGLDDDSVREAIAAMKDEGMFDVTDWAG